MTALIRVVAVLRGAANAQAVSDFQYHRLSRRMDVLLLAVGLSSTDDAVVLQPLGERPPRRRRPTPPLGQGLLDRPVVR